MPLMTLMVVVSSSMFLTTNHTSLHAAIELHGDQLGELGGDVCHRIFCSTEAGSQAEQRADFAESFVRRLVHNGDELVTRQKCGKLFVGDALCWRRPNSAGVTSTIPTRDFARPCRFRGATVCRNDLASS